jgi:hypothetical protein
MVRRGKHTVAGEVNEVGAGTPLQIVRAMQDLAFGVQDLSTQQYIEWVVENAQKFEGVELGVEGDTDDELATSLVDAMIRAGLTFEV